MGVISPVWKSRLRIAADLQLDAGNASPLLRRRHIFRQAFEGCLWRYVQPHVYPDLLLSSLRRLAMESVEADCDPPQA